MNVKRKSIIGLMVTTLFMTPTLPSAALAEKDMQPINVASTEAVNQLIADRYPDIKGHWGQLYIEYLVKEDIIHGYPNGTIRPNDPVTREEAVKMIISQKGYDLSEQPSQFSDVEDGYWAEEYINLAADKGFVTGYQDGTFGPKNELTRGELASILVRAYGLEVINEKEELPYPDVDKNDWAYESIQALHQNGYVDGLPNGDFGAFDNVTRAEFAAFLERIVNPNPVDETVITNPVETDRPDISDLLPPIEHVKDDPVVVEEEHIEDEPLFND